MDVKALVAHMAQFLKIDANLLANAIGSFVAQANPPPSSTTSGSAASSQDSDMEFSDTMSATSSSSRKRSAISNKNSSDSDGTLTDETPFTEVKRLKSKKKRAAKNSAPDVPATPAPATACASPAPAVNTPAAPAAASVPAAPVAASVSAAPAAASVPAASAAATPTPMSSDIKTSKPASRCAPTLAKQQVPPPVFLRDKAQFTRLSKICYNAGIKYDTATNLGESIKIVPQSIDDFRRMTRLFTAERVAYHTYALSEELKVKAVLRGVPFELANEDILEDLKSQGFPVEAVHKMHSNKGKRFPLALVILTNVPEAKSIFQQVRTVCGLSRVRVEPPHRRGFPAQCHRCQLYGHAAANCSAPPRCVKCLDPHSSKECPRPRNDDLPPYCVLCQQTGHPASYRGCPRAPRPRLFKAAKPAPPPVNDRSFPALPLKTAIQGPSRPPQELPKPPQGPVQPIQGPSQPSPPLANPWAPKKAAPSRTASAPQQAQSSLADDLKTVYSVIRNVDIGEIAALARKLRAAQSPQDRLLALAEHHNLLSSL